MNKGRALEGGETEGERDPMEKKNGWWCCPVCKHRKKLDEPKPWSRCKENCGKNIGREKAIEQCEKDLALSSPTERAEERHRKIREETPEEEIDVMEGGFEEDVHYRFEQGRIGSSGQPQELSLRLPLVSWSVVLKDKASSSR